METSELFLLLGAALILAGSVWWWLRRRQRAITIGRLTAPVVSEEEEEREVRVPSGIVPRHRWVPVLGVLLVGAGLHWLGGLDLLFAGAASLGGVVIVGLVINNIVQKRSLKYETQLTEAIDLIVAGLHAGAGTLDALDVAAREVRPPLRHHLNNLVGSIRLGESPRAALDELARTIPLESYRLFTFTLSVHQETGGSLAPTLSTVGRTIRDRVELKRRIRAETTQAQASVIGVLGISYGIALITWRTNPGRMEDFIASDIGTTMLSIAVALQAIGLFWMSRLTRIQH
jgi:tight adherence protein B